MQQDHCPPYAASDLGMDEQSALVMILGLVSLAEASASQRSRSVELSLLNQEAEPEAVSIASSETTPIGTSVSQTRQAHEAIPAI